MNKLEFIERLKQNMPKDLNDIEIAKYIYIQLGKEKSFDEKYFFGNRKTKEQIYKRAEMTNYNTDIVAENRKIICVSLSYLYRDILKEFGIQSMIEQEGDHKYIILLLKDQTRLRADLQLDLYNIQTKCKTKNFGTKSKYDSVRLSEISDNLMLQIDKNIGYIQTKEDYKDDDIEKLKSKVEDKSASEALEIIFNDEKVNKIERDLGFIELSKYYRGILNKTMFRYLDKKVFAFNCYREKEDGEKEYTMCAYSEDKNESVNVYMFSRKNNKFLKVELRDIEKLEQEGLVLGVRKKEQGVKKLKKVIEKEKEKSEKVFE